MSKLMCVKTSYPSVISISCARPAHDRRSPFANHASMLALLRSLYHITVYMAIIPKTQAQISRRYIPKTQVDRYALCSMEQRLKKEFGKYCFKMVFDV